MTGEGEGGEREELHFILGSWKGGLLQIIGRFMGGGLSETSGIDVLFSLSGRGRIKRPALLGGQQWIQSPDDGFSTVFFFLCYLF